jgi:hypothetical protein
MVKVDRTSQAGFGLEPRHIGGEEVAPADRHRVGEREQAWQDRRRRMAAERVAAVVEVERMGGRAVHQRGIDHRQALRRAEHQRRANAAGHAERDFCARLGRAGERDPHGVEYAGLRPAHRGRGQGVKRDRADARRKLGCDRHGRLLRSSRSMRVT